MRLRSSLAASVLLAASGIGNLQAGLINSTLAWQYYGAGGAYSPQPSPPYETSGTFTVNGGVGGTFIGPPSGGNLSTDIYFDIDADDTHIFFDYSVANTTGPWSSSPLSLGPTIHNGIAINLLSPGAFTAVTIDPLTNMTGFDTSRFSFAGNQLQVDWQNLNFDTSTIVEFDVATSASPEPGTIGLFAVGLCALGLWVRRPDRASTNSRHYQK